MDTTATITYVSESFIKPKLENMSESNQPYILSPWNLQLLSVHYVQIGLVFVKTPPQTFSFGKLVESLKDSLALTLVHFYPLAGQLTTQIDKDLRKCVVLVDYNKGAGARFTQATLNMPISDILSPTYIPRIVYSLFDHEETVVNFDGRSMPLLTVQVTELLDGIFIGCSFNHAILDGVSFYHFLRIWAEIHSSKITPPSPISRPPIIGDGSFEHAFSYYTHPDEFITWYKSPPEMKARIFRFSTDSMRWLKSRANKDIINNNITISSFQALSALIWRAVVRAIGLSPHEITNCSLPMNVRKRLEPPFPEEYFGNLIHSVVASTTVEELLGHNLGWVASLLQKSVLNYDRKSWNGFISSWLEAPSFIDLNKMTELHCVTIGGSPTFDIYSHKFAGLGAPVATRFGIGNKFPGKVYVLRAFEGGASVEVEICLMPQSMAALQSDMEFIDIASFPNALLCRSQI